MKQTTTGRHCPAVQSQNFMVTPYDMPTSLVHVFEMQTDTRGERRSLMRVMAIAGAFWPTIHVEPRYTITQ